MVNILELLEKSADVYCSRTAFADEKENISYADVVHRAKTIGSALSGQINNRAVAIFIPKSIHTLISFFGVVYGGGFFGPGVIHFICIQQ